MKTSEGKGERAGQGRGQKGNTKTKVCECERWPKAFISLAQKYLLRKVRLGGVEEGNGFYCEGDL